VFNVLQDHGMLQPTPDGKAIWRAIVTSSTGWSHSFTLLRLAPALIWESGERPAPFAGTVTTDAALAGEDAEAAATLSADGAASTSENQNAPPAEGSGIASAPPPKAQATPDVMEDMLAMVDTGNSPTTDQDVETVPDEALIVLSDAPLPTLADVAPSPPASTSSTTQPSGEHFMAWLKQGIATRRLIINDAKALVHTVSDTAYLVSPGVFQRYAQEHPQVGKLARQESLQDWQWVQKRFERLQLHRKQSSGLNIWTCEVTGPRKSRKLHGYLLVEPQLIFGEMPPNNPYLKAIAVPVG
jgi:hypothetical protein